MKNNLRIFPLFFLLGCLLLTNSVFAQKKGRQQNPKQQAASQSLSESVAEENSALFIDAVKERLCENYELAEEKLHKVILVDPSHDAAYYELAILMTVKGSLREAVLYTNKAMEINPENHWYHLMAADLYNRLGDYPQSEPYWKKLTEKFPDNLDYLNNYAFTLLQQQKLAEALKVYDLMQKQIGPDESLIEAKKSIYLYLNKVDEAAREIEVLADANPLEPKYLVEIADIYRVNKKEKKAIPYLEKALSLDSNNVNALLYLYYYYGSQRNMEQTRTQMLRKLFAHPELSLTFKQSVMSEYFAAYLNGKGDYDASYELAEILTKTHPQESGVWAQKADFLIASGNYAGAIELLQRSLSLDSSVYKVWQAYLQLLVHENRTETCDEAERAISLFPMQFYPYVAHAWCMMQYNEFPTVIEDLERVLKIMPDDVDLQMVHDVYGMLMTAYMNNGDADKAEDIAKEYQRREQEFIRQMHNSKSPNK